jgi:hypothetical protein
MGIAELRLAIGICEEGNGLTAEYAEDRRGGRMRGEIQRDGW